MAKFVGRVTSVDLGGNGGSATTFLKSKKGRKKKVTKWLRPTERVVRQYIKAERRCWSDLLGRYNKSRGKKRDRWLTDGLGNSFRSIDKGCRVFGKI